MEPDGRVEVELSILRYCPFFDSFDLDELRVFLEHAVILRHDRGHYLARDHEASDCFYVIAYGGCDVYKGKKTVAHLASGDVFGEITFLMNMPRTATVITNAPSVLIRVDHQLLEGAGERLQLKLFKKLAGILARRLTQTTELLAY